LPVEQRLEAMQAVAKSGLPVDRFLVGTGAAALSDAARLTTAARDLGYGGALLLPPFYYKGIDTQGLVTYIGEVIARAGAQGLRLYLYHFPALSGVPYTIETVRAITRRFPETVRGLKDSSGDLAYASALARENPGLDVFPSAEGALAAPEAALFAGCISATVNVTASVVAAGWRSRDEAERARRFAEAAELRALFTPLPLIAAVKTALADRDSDPEWERVVPPLRPLSSGERDALRNALAAKRETARAA
jgi:4-hydroxy-tetrahydrodipicolinate synthase